MSFAKLKQAMEIEGLESLEKLVLLVLCHCYNDDTGKCFPSRAFIQKRTGIKNNKTLTRKIEALESCGLISVNRSCGLVSSYTLNLDNPPGSKVNQVQNRTRFKSEPTPGSKVNQVPGSKVNHEHINEHIKNKETLIHTSYGLSSDDKSSTDTAHPPRGSSSNNPPEKSSAKKEKSEEEIRKSKAIEVSKHCPQQKIIDIYLEELPELTQVCTWTASKRVNNMRARWREMAMNQLFQSEDEGLEFFRTFFQFVKDSKFLMGKIHNPRKKPFKCSLPWLLEPEHFADVIDHKYHDER